MGTQVSVSLVLYSGYRLRTKGLPVDCSMRLGLHRKTALLFVFKNNSKVFGRASKPMRKDPGMLELKVCRAGVPEIKHK